MTKPSLSEADYIAKLNERLKAKVLYEDGMAFVAMSPDDGRSQVTGFDWHGARFHRTLFLQVAQEVSSQFGMRGSPQDDDEAAGAAAQHFHAGYHAAADGLMYDYTVRYGAGASPAWDVQITPQGGAPISLNGRMDANLYGGEALKAALSVMIESMIDDGCCQP